jgi:hypothetical protein
VDVITDEADSLIAFPQDVGVAYRVSIQRKLLPCRSAAVGRVVVVNRIVVSVDAADAAFVDHAGGDVLEDVVLDQVVGAVIGIDTVTFGRRVPRAVEIAVPHHAGGRLVEPDVLVLTVDVADVLEPDVIPIEDEHTGRDAAAGVGVIHRERSSTPSPDTGMLFDHQACGDWLERQFGMRTPGETPTV